VTNAKVTSLSSGLSTTTQNLGSLSTAIAPIVDGSNAARSAGATLVGTTVGGGTGGIVQTQGPQFNNAALTSVNQAGLTVANGVDTTATGLGARAGTGTAPAAGATAYGAYASAMDENATAVGYRAVAKFTGSVAIGNQAQAIADPATAIGDNSLAAGNNSVAIGASAQATGNNSVALGAHSVADQANTVSVGSPGAERRITNVAPGVNATDAVNLSQLRDVSRIAYSGVAMSFAMSGAVMPALDPGEKGVGIGMGSYQGYGAVALQFRSLSGTGQSAWGMGVTTTGKEWGMQLGWGFKWK
jgi:trimeric autotransporter adhesin